MTGREELEGPRVQRGRDFLLEFARKVGRSDLFFMAGAITFNVLVAVVPLFLLVVGLGGLILQARIGDPSEVLLSLVLEYLPAVGGDIELQNTVRGLIERVLAESAGFSLVGALFFIWISTRLSGTLRVVLRDVFELESDRGMVLGKLYDALIVIVGGVLVVVNLGVTVAVRAVRDLGVAILGLEGWGAALTHTLVANTLAFGSAWVLCFLIYRYLPARRTGWSTSAVAATVTAVFFEVTKAAFTWYATEVADFSTAYGNLTTFAVLFFWIYYGSLVFILGGMVGFVYGDRRRRRMGRTARSGSSGAGTVALLVLVAFAAAPGAALGQGILSNGGSNGFSGANGSAGGVLFADRVLDRELALDRSLLNHDGPYVIVHVAENRVFVVEDDRIIWSSPAGTGHGFELEGAGQEWTFTTPVGVMRVYRKEKDPVWVAPDWYFVQRGLPVPARNDPSRRIGGTLGTTAIYLGDGIAIHGTDRPELLMDPDPEARRISHGCIRLTDEAARELYHFVEVGTPVLLY